MTRNIRSRPGMEHSEALLSLQRVARKNDEEIVRFARQGDVWVATLQTIADFPPDGGDGGGEDGPPTPKKKPAGEMEPDGDEGGPDEDGDGDGAPDGPPSDGEGTDGPPGADGPPKPPGAEHGHGGGGEHHQLQMVMDSLHKILQGLEGAGLIPKGR